MSANWPAVHLVQDPETIALISDYERSQILRLLSNRPMTGTMLADRIGITKAAVGYHLGLLIDADLIRVERSEAESHGILQKFYTTAGAVFVVNPSQIPREVRRHFIRAQTYRLRGLLGLPLLLNRSSESDLSMNVLEEMAEGMLQQVYQLGCKYENLATTTSSESIDIALHAEAFKNLLQLPEWSARLRQYSRAFQSPFSQEMFPR